MSRRSTPSIVMRPASGSCSRATSAASVLLPDPVSPTRARRRAGRDVQRDPGDGRDVAAGVGEGRRPRAGRALDPGRVDVDRAAGSSTSTGRSRYSKIRANSASELINDTPTLSRPTIGRKSPACSAVNATSVPIVSIPAVNGRPAVR